MLVSVCLLVSLQQHVQGLLYVANYLFLYFILLYSLFDSFFNKLLLILLYYYYSYSVIDCVIA